MHNFISYIQLFYMCNICTHMKPWIWLYYILYLYIHNNVLIMIDSSLQETNGNLSLIIYTKKIYIQKNLKLSYFHASLSLKTHLLKLHHIMFQNGWYLTIVDGDSIYSFNIDLFTTTQSTMSLMLIRHGFSCMIKETKYETKKLFFFSFATFKATICLYIAFLSISLHSESQNLSYM